MFRKKLIMLGMTVGSIAGGYLPVLLGSNDLMASLLAGMVGGVLGILAAYKLSG